MVELGWDDVHGWAGMGGTQIGTTRFSLSPLPIMYLVSLTNSYILSWALCSSDKNLLTLPQMSLELLVKAVRISMLTVGNLLPGNCKHGIMISTCRSALKPNCFRWPTTSNSHKYHIKHFQLTYN